MPIGCYQGVMKGVFTMAKKQLPIPPIRKNPRLGRFTETDAAVVIGNSRPDVIVGTKSKHNTTDRHTDGIQKVARRKPKRNRRVSFVPNKVSKSKLSAWKKKYGLRYYLTMINTAIEKYEP